MVFAYIPVVLYAIQRQIWLEFAVIVRYLLLPKNELNHIDVAAVKRVAYDFLSNVSGAYGDYSLSYNCHLIRHVDKLRVRGESAYLTSTFPFESLYFDIVSAICAGKSGNCDV